MSKTAKTGDKRKRDDLELFLLAMIDKGVNSPYTLMEVAALSPGATIPALSRLENAGWVKKGEEQARRRSEYSVTRTGRRHLEERWRSVFSSDPTGEMETLLRIATLARLMGAPVKSVKAYLIRAAKLRTVGRPVTARSSERLGLYGLMKQVADSKRLAADAAALRAIAKSLKK